MQISKGQYIVENGLMKIIKNLKRVRILTGFNPFFLL